MTDPMYRLRLLGTAVALVLGAASAVAQLQIRNAAPAPSLQVRGPAFNGDYIIAVVNSDLVTAAELQQRIDRAG